MPPRPWRRAFFAAPAVADHVASSESGSAGHGVRLVMPIMNPARRMKLFVDRGCVTCHAINGVSGHDAPAMDAAQESELGEQIYFTGQELADIIAFIHDDQAQHSFSEKNITAKARSMMEHEHGGETAVEKHGPEIGHQTAPE